MASFEIKDVVFPNRNMSFAENWWEPDGSKWPKDGDCFRMIGTVLTRDDSLRDDRSDRDEFAEALVEREDEIVPSRTTPELIAKARRIVEAKGA